MAQSADLLSLELPCEPRAAMMAREALSEIHDGGWSLDDGRLVASELVGNAVRHSGCAGEHRLHITVARREHRLVISVHDPGLSGRPARPAQADGPQLGGWGLRVIAALSEAWGAERPDGYLVWAELAARG